MVYTVFYKTSSFAGYCFLDKNSIHPKRRDVFNFEHFKVTLVKFQICSFIVYIFVYISEKIHVSVNYFFVGMIFIGLGIDYYSIRVPFFNEYTSRGYFAFFCGIIIADIVIR